MKGCILQNQFGLLLTFTKTKPYLKKKTSRKHLRFSELSLNYTYSFLLYSFFFFMTSIQISILNEKENLNSVCLPR